MRVADLAGKKSVFIVLSDIVYWFLFNFVSTNSHSIECIGLLAGGTLYEGRVSSSQSLHTKVKMSLVKFVWA